MNLAKTVIESADNSASLHAKDLRRLAAAALIAVSCGGTEVIAAGHDTRIADALITVTCDYTSIGSVWHGCRDGAMQREFDKRFLLPDAICCGMIKMRRIGPNRAISLTISASQGQYNVFTAATSPTDAVDVTLTVNSGVVVMPALVPIIPSVGILTAGFSAGSTLKIINLGFIYGGGGYGGDGANGSGGFAWGAQGGNGGDAIDITRPLTIDNSSGYVFGGGGGGPGGRSMWFSAFDYAGGGGGGGGQPNGAGGGFGDTFQVASAATAGTAGSVSSPGSAGTGGVAFGGSTGGGGYAGSLWGADSQDNGSGDGFNGKGGYAIRLNGYSITWLGGNNGTQVKGLVA